MNQEALTHLVLRSQSGDSDAMEALLLWAHTPISWLCKKLLQNPAAAGELTHSILSLLSSKLNTLPEPERFEAWMCRIVAARCVQLLPRVRGENAGEAVDLGAFCGRTLDAEETVQAISALIDALPEAPRVCLLLYCCTGMNSSSVAQVTGYSVTAVRSNLSRGQALLQNGLEQLQEHGTEFSGITSLQDILCAAMHHADDPDAAIAVVYPIIGKALPAPPDPTRWLRRLLGSLVALLSVTLAGQCALLVLKLLGVM